MVTLPAHLVATPVLERLTPGPQEGVVLGAGTTAAWVDLDGFVIAITTREVPLLPNAIALSAGSGALVGADAGAGVAARLAPGRVGLGSVQVTWDPAAPPGWEPTVPVPSGATRQAVGARGAALLRALGAEGAVDNHQHTPSLVRELGRIGLATAADPEGAAGLAWLFRGIRERDPEPAATGARELLGRGPGLTPEGDDLLAGVCIAAAAAGDPLALPPGARALTTPLSATLLELAAAGAGPKPVHALLDLTSERWGAALRELEGLGASSGRAIALGVGAAAAVLGASHARRVPPRAARHFLV